MANITTRASKGASLSWNEADANFINLNNDKLEASALAPYLTSATAASTYETQAHASSTYETQSHASATYPTKANNLSDLASASTARTNLGLGDAATKTIGTSSGQVPTADQIPSLVPSSASILGAFRNLQASANGTTANVSITADELVVENSSNVYVTLRSISLTVAGTSVGANALDAGTITTSTWYSIWVIWNGTTVAGLLSTSATSPTLPSGYTYKARVGWIRTDGTANKYPLAFKQYGRKVKYTPLSGSNLTYYPTIASSVAGTALASGSVTWSSALSVTTFFPTTASFITAIAINSGYVALSDSTLYVGIYGSAATPFAGSSNNTGDRCIGEFPYTTNLYVAGNSGTPNVHALGWEDNL